MAHKTTTERTKELKAMSLTDLDGALDAAYKGMYRIRRERLSKPQENVKETGAYRKEIARILTFKRQRELAAGTK